MQEKIYLDTFVTLLDQSYTNEQLASYFNCGVTTIKRYKKENGLVGYKTNSKPLSIKQIEEIEALVNSGYSLAQVATKVGRTDYILKKYLPTTLYTQLVTNSRSVFASNLIKADISNIFKADEYSAYICGVLQSDGFLTSDGYIGLTAKDKDFVEVFAKFFKTGVRVVEQNGRTYYGCRFKDIRNLEKFKEVTNIFPNKTYSEYTIPDWIVSNSTFMQHFIAGVFDGDGWVSKVTGRINTVEIGIEQHSMSYGFLVNINKYLGWNIYKTESTARISTKAHAKTLEFYNWYSSIEFAMLRKVSIFDSIYL